MELSADGTTTRFDLLVEIRPRLERALVARFGTDLGVEAAAAAIGWGWEHRERLATMANPAGYLYRVGQSAVRWERRRRRVVLPPERSAPGEAIDEDLGALLARLPDRQRVAVLMVHAHGYSYAEVGEVLGEPVSSVRNHVHRGLQRLRAMTKEER